MRPQHTAATTRRLQRVLGGALGAMLVAVGVLIPTASASAMTQVGAVQSGLPGGTVTAQIQNQQGGTGSWTITAPPNTRITAAQSIPGPGLGAFSCTPLDGGLRADCSTTTWGAGNTVIVTMVIDVTAPIGTVAGSSGIAPFEAAAPFSVTVVPPEAPAAPTITAPAAGSESITTLPTITGTKAAGNAATVTIDGAALCAPPADDTAAWSCTPADDLTVGGHTVTATQTDRFGQVSPVTTSTFTVLAPAAFTITQSGAERLIPAQPAIHTVTIANGGEGEARGVRLTADLGGFPSTTCRIGGAAVDCSGLPMGIEVGTIAAGSSATLTITGAAPEATTPGTTYTIATSASSTTASVSPVDSDATLTVVRPPSPFFTQPTAGSRTTERRPGIFGKDGVAGAQVTVRQGSTVVCGATARLSGNWSCTARQPLPYGAVTLTATQVYGGLTSEAGSRTFTVLRPSAAVPPPTRPGGSTPVPGTGSAPVGGGSTAPGGSGGTGAPGVPSAAPTPAPAPAAPAPSSSGAPSTAPDPSSGSGGSGTSGSSASSGGGTGDIAPRGGALRMDLRFGTQRITPGTAADMRGTLGPNTSGGTVAIAFTGRMTPGMIYRDVAVDINGERVPCTVATTTFSCTVPLDPDQQADVAIRVFADPVNAPDTAVQQIRVASNRSAQSNAMTVTTVVAAGQTEASQLADQITTFNVTEFPGAMVPLLAILLFALAATVAGRRPTGQNATTPVATNPSPGGDPPGGTTASSPNRLDDQSGSNR